MFMSQRRPLFYLLQVKDMTTRVRKSFINNLRSQDWMDKSTKDAAKEKVC